MAGTKELTHPCSFFSPTLTWRSQEAVQFSAWGKIEFHTFPPKPWSEILTHASEDARDLVSRLIRYESGDRLSADAVSLRALLSLFKVNSTQLIEHVKTDVRGKSSRF